MATQIVKYRLANGATVLVEADEPTVVGREEIALPFRTGELPDWGASLGNVIPAIEEVFDKLRSLATSPTGIELEVGIKIIGSAGAILAKVGGEASMTVKLKWDRAKPPGT